MHTRIGAYMNAAYKAVYQSHSQGSDPWPAGHCGPAGPEHVAAKTWGRSRSHNLFGELGFLCEGVSCAEDSASKASRTPSTLKCIPVPSDRQPHVCCLPEIEKTAEFQLDDDLDDYRHRHLSVLFCCGAETRRAVSGRICHLARRSRAGARLGAMRLGVKRVKSEGGRRCLTHVL